MKCNLCPRKCNVDRSKQKSYCNGKDRIKVALVSTHYFEEPCISGTNGSGTIFFSNCNLDCMFCQNYKISKESFGKEITIERLAEIMIEQQERKVNNINLVSPTVYADKIIEAIKIARKNGLKIPIAYNTNGYETVETLKMLEGYIDIYLTDFKYFNDELANKYSKVKNYYEVATRAILEMQRQIPEPVFDENNIMKKGLIVRHLILPNYMQNSKNVLKWIKDNLNDDIYISVMSQYFPEYKAVNDDKLNRNISKKEYKIIERYMFELDFKNGYIQDFTKCDQSKFVPNFNLDNV